MDRAYRTAQRTYGDGSLALYSIFGRNDAAAIRERLDEAYRVLSDAELRADYDEKLGDEKLGAEKLGHESQGDDHDRQAAENFTRGSVSASGSDEANGIHGESGGIGEGRSARADLDHRSDSLGAMDAGSLDAAVEEYDALEDDGRGEFDGVRLRRNRLFRGYEIDDISDVTKVSSAHLRNIEAENFLDLPADVYVRGFVTAYAKTIGLDPKVVVPSYMQRVQESRNTSQRSRFLSRN